MKTVDFCGGLGTRIRDVSETIRHEGFWRPMDTLKDKQVLEDLVEEGMMPWHLNGAPRLSVGAAQRKIR